MITALLNSDGEIIQFNGTKDPGMDGANYNPVPSEAVALFVAPHKNWTEGDPLANPVVQVNGDLVQLTGSSGTLSIGSLAGADSVDTDDGSVLTLTVAEADEFYTAGISITNGYKINDTAAKIMGEIEESSGFEGSPLDPSFYLYSVGTGGYQVRVQMPGI